MNIKKIYADSELEETATIRNFRIVQTSSSRQVIRNTKHYTIKGWVMDDECLKNSGSVLTVVYFDRLLEQIREIRLSERRFYQKITPILC